MRLEEALARANRKLVVPYVTAGLPTPQAFIDLVSELGEMSDAIEVGIPYSDPIMDGPVIQAASVKALSEGVTPMRALDLVAQAARHTQTPLCVMTYYNPIHALGEEQFAQLAAERNIAGAIVPDLPVEESAGLGKALSAKSLALVQLIAPTSSDQRVKLLASAARGFVYAVARLGVTGVSPEGSSVVAPLIERIRPHTDLKVVAGIGISGPEQAVEACGSADGVIVGSAVVRRVLAGDLRGAVDLIASIRRAIG